MRGDATTVLEQARRYVLEHILHLHHPRCFAFVPSPSDFVGVLADALVAGFTPFAGASLEAASLGRSGVRPHVELVTTDRSGLDVRRSARRRGGSLVGAA